MGSRIRYHKWRCDCGIAQMQHGDQSPPGWVDGHCPRCSNSDKISPLLERLFGVAERTTFDGQPGFWFGRPGRPKVIIEQREGGGWTYPPLMGTGGIRVCPRVATLRAALIGVMTARREDWQAQREQISADLDWLADRVADIEACTDPLLDQVADHDS